MTYLDDIESLVNKEEIKAAQDVESYLDNVVEHFGTRGMRWGVRKQERKSDKEWAKKVKESGPEITGNVIAKSKPIIDKINGKPEYRNIKNANESTYKKYLSEHQTAFNKALHEEITKTVGWESPSGKAKTVYLIDNNGALVVDSIKSTKLPDSLQQDSFTDNIDEFYLPKLKSIVVDRMIVGYELDTDDDIIEHFGVRGMRWGVRKDRSSGGEIGGSSTAATSGKSDDAIKARDAVRKAKKSSTDSLSNNELQAAITRMNLEQQYSKLTAKPDSFGKKFIKKILVTTLDTTAKVIINQQVNQTLTKAGLIGQAAGVKPSKKSKPSTFEPMPPRQSPSSSSGSGIPPRRGPIIDTTATG